MIGEIFEELKIQKSDPICSIIDDVIDEKNIYSEDLILDCLADSNENDELVQINYINSQYLRQFLSSVYDQSKGTFMNLIDFILLKEICKSVCYNIHAAHCFNHQNEYTEEDKEIWLE